MFVFLSKKIAVPNNLRLNCIAWNRKQGYIAVGGEDGLLKVLRSESNSSNSNNAAGTSNGSIKNRSNAASNLSMNQALEGHTGHVQVVTWNEEHQKLTSSDQNGVIIVWMLYKGSWYEEMINNRNKSVVRSMSWSSNGQRICIVYEDGAVIVGSVEGSRIWGKEIKGACLTAVKWSPDGKFLLFGSRNGEVNLYDEQGNFVVKLEQVWDSYSYPVTCIDWYDGKNGYMALDCAVLAIAFQSGKICLLKDTNDENHMTIETEMTSVWCTWNTYGSILAVAGTNSSIISTEKKDANVIQFYSPSGELLKILKLPGKEVTCCSWEGGSHRLCMSIDSNIYFANVRVAHKWAYFHDTVVFSNERIGKEGVCINFWNVESKVGYSKYVPVLLGIAARGDHCVIAAKNNGTQDEEPYVLYVCNAISTAVDTKFLETRPVFLAMTSNVVIAASKNAFLVWYFRAPQNVSLNIARSRRDRLYHVDDTPTGVEEPSANSGKTKDRICSLAATEKILLVARESGMIQQYSLPQVALTHRYQSCARIKKMYINCDSTKACVIDASDILRLLELKDSDGKSSSEYSKPLEDIEKFERRDVWDICWADDNPELLAVAEKARMYIFRGLDPEEPLSSLGYLCNFRNLELKCILLDELISKSSEELKDLELVTNLETKSLRDSRDLLGRVGLSEAHDFIRDNPHPRLWKLLAESALEQLDLDMAENALVRCSDYLGIKFVKRLRNVQDNRLKKAEVDAFLGRYDEAEAAYLELDRRDLAIALRQKLGDDVRVLKLMRMGAGGSDKETEQAHLRLGQQCAARQDWRAAKDHFEHAGDLDKLIDCYYRLEDYDKLGSLVSQLPENSEGLKKLAKILASSGMCQEAVNAYVKLGDVKQAVDTCVRTNRWDQALELARSCKIPQIGELLAKYAKHLLTAGRRFEAIELYKKAECRLEAAKLLMNLAEEQSRGSGRSNPLRLKKLYVLGALLVQEHLEAVPAPRALGRSGLMLGLSQPISEDAKLIEGAWRGAEAYHFLLLTHRQLYAGDVEAATRTALRLVEYEDILESEDVNGILALTGCASHAFAVASKAFSRLEALESLSQSKREEYENLAVEVFLKNPVKDQIPFVQVDCPNCGATLNDWSISCPGCACKFPGCVVTGKPLHDISNTWLCTTCKHRAISEREVVNINACPLCHSIVTYM